MTRYHVYCYECGHKVGVAENGVEKYRKLFKHLDTKCVVVKEDRR